jgi:hypothetical protein
LKFMKFLVGNYILHWWFHDLPYGRCLEAICLRNIPWIYFDLLALGVQCSKTILTLYNSGFFSSDWCLLQLLSKENGTGFVCRCSLHISTRLEYGEALAQVLCKLGKFVWPFLDLH